MVGAAILLTLVLVLGTSFILFDALNFLRPFRGLIRAQYLPVVGLFLALMTVNIFAASLLLVRKLGLRTAGAKLKHLEKEGLAGTALASEIVSDEQE